MDRSFVEQDRLRNLGIVAGVALLCIFWGYAVVVAEWNALFVGIAVLACMLVLLDFRLGVVLLILLMPLSYSEIFPRQIAGIPGFNPVNLLLVGTLGAFVLTAILQRNGAPVVPRPLLWLFVVPFVIAGVMGSRHVGEIPAFFFITERIDFINATGYIRDLVVKPLFLIIFALLLGGAVARSTKPERFLPAIVISICIISLMVVVYFVLSGSSLGQIARSDARGFFSPLGMHANELGRLYVIAFAILLFTWAGTTDYTGKVLLLAAIGIVAVALVLTFSRGSFAGVVLVVTLFLISRRSIAGLLFGGLAVAMILFLLPDAVYERVSYGVGGGANAISAGRIEGLWLPLLPDLMKSPIYGNGLWSTLWSDAMRSGRAILVTHPHNAYLQTALDMGIVGLILVCAYFVHVWRGFRSLAADPAVSDSLRGFFAGAAAGLAAFLMGALVDGTLTPKPEQFFLWLAIGMMYGMRARKAAAG